MERVYVVGSGPNGLAAAITLARTGLAVDVREAQPAPGGGATSAALTLPGFVHDVCSAVHPMAAASPFFSSIRPARAPAGGAGGRPTGRLEWIQPPAPLAHPLDDGTAVLLHRDLGDTAANLGEDGRAWGELFGPIVSDWEVLKREILGPIGLPRHPLVMARFGLRAMRSARGLARGVFRGTRARALFAGIAAHSVLRLDHTLSAAVGLVLGAAGHAVGWPIPRGGSQRITDALCAELASLSGVVRTSSPVRSLEGLDGLVLCDVSPRALASIAGDRLPAGFRRKLKRFRYGPGAYKVDYALAGPIPWRARECALAATVHVGGTLEEIALSEKDAWEGRPAEKPFVLLAQPSLFDSTRAPEGRHTAWAYCHVPHGSDADMLARIEAQIERFAPGFRERILARSVMAPAALEARNANLVGGSITGGVADLGQSLFRPTWRNYGTPVRGLFLCSASTPPGGGVHGMCGYHAARAALRSA